MNERIKTEMISRRKALSLLGLGAALGFTLSAALEPLEAEAQEATGPPPRPLRPPEHTGCNGGKGGAPIAMSDGTAAMSDATSDERVRNQRRPRPPQQLQRNRGPSAFERQIARSDRLRIAYPFGGPRNARDRRRKEKEETKVPRHRRIHGKASCDDRTAATRIRSGVRGRQLREARHACSGARVRPKPIRIKTVHSAPWYVRGDLFAKRADQVTVYVLLGVETATPARFFVVKNSDLAAQFRQPPTWKAFGFIDVKSVEKYEDNWDLLK